MSAAFGPGRARSRREAVDIREPKARDRTLERLLGVRKQRLERLERESLEARQSWRATRAQLHRQKLAWRQALEDAQDFWQRARAQFFAMETSSGQFRAAKGGFNRMKTEAAQLRLEWRETLAAGRRDGTAFFAARQRLSDARHQQEKLKLFDDELRLAEAVHDD